MNNSVKSALEIDLNKSALELIVRNKPVQEVVPVASKVVVVEAKQIKADVRPEYNVIDKLSSSVLDYIYQQSKSSGLSYETVLAIADVESEFDVNAKSPTSDYGLFQLNKRNHKWLSELAGIDNLNPLNPKHNTRMATVYLSYLHEHYRELGYSEGNIEKYQIASYHRGIRGVEKYVDDVNQDSYYLKVMKAEKEIKGSEQNKK